MLRCAVLRLSVGAALRKFRNPGLRSPMGRGAGPILIACCGGKVSASFSKKLDQKLLRRLAGATKSGETKQTQTCQKGVLPGFGNRDQFTIQNHAALGYRAPKLIIDSGEQDVAQKVRTGSSGDENAIVSARASSDPAPAVDGQRATGPCGRVKRQGTRRVVLLQIES